MKNLLFIFSLITLLNVSCVSDTDVKFELTGTEISATINNIYCNGNFTEDNPSVPTSVQIPWTYTNSYETSIYDSNNHSAGFTATKNSNDNSTLTASIYVDGDLESSQSTSEPYGVVSVSMEKFE
jgi:hypothetical protein